MAVFTPFNNFSQLINFPLAGRYILPPYFKDVVLSIEELVEKNNWNLKRLSDYKNKDYIFKNSAFTLWGAFETRAWCELIKSSDLGACKSSFYNCGLIDIECGLFNDNIFSAGRNRPLYAALSDNTELHKQFSDINYIMQGGPHTGKTFKDIAKKGHDELYIDCIIKALNLDLDGLKENIKILENVTLKKKTRQWMLPDYEFFKSILTGNKDLAFNSINLLSTKHHRKRNTHSFELKDVVSQPAMGFAKIAWINGMQLEFESPLIFNELLPISNNIKYTDEVKSYKEIMTLLPPYPGYNGHKIKI